MDLAAEAGLEAAHLLGLGLVELHGAAGLHGQHRRGGDDCDLALLVAVGAADVEGVDVHVAVRDDGGVGDLADVAGLSVAPDGEVAAALPADYGSGGLRRGRGGHLGKLDRVLGYVGALLKALLGVALDEVPERAVLLEGRIARGDYVVLEHVGIELRGAVLDGLYAAGDGGQDLILDLDELDGLVGYLAGLRRDEGDGVAYVEHRLAQYGLHRGPAHEPALVDVLVGQHGGDAVELLGLLDVDALYPRVGVGAALGAADEHPRQGEVVEEGAFAGDYLARVLARDVHAAYVAVVFLGIVLVTEVIHLLPSHFSSSSTPRPATEAMASKTWYWLMQRQ